MIDELSFVVAHLIVGSEDKPRFMNSTMADYKAKKIEQYNDGVGWENYIRK